MNRLPIFSFALLSVVFFAFAGCAGAGDGGDGDSENNDCAADMTVSSGLTPEFTWEGGPALGLAVAEYNEAAARKWVLGVAGADGFEGPVTYGTIPTNAIEAEGAPEDLETGVEYSVTVTLADANVRCQLFTP